MSSQLYLVLLSLSCSIICHRSKYKLNCSIRSMSNSQLFNNHHGSHALFSFITLDSKCIPYVFLLYYPVYSFVDFNKSSLQKKTLKNWDSPTRVPPNAELSSPDVSLASTSLITSCSWQTLSTLSSDHLPILIRLQMKTTSTPGLRRTYVNLKKADWDRYRQELGTALSNRSLPTDSQRNEKIFRTVLLKAASHHIPTGRHILHVEPVPVEIMDVMTRRDDLLA